MELNWENNENYMQVSFPVDEDHGIFYAIRNYKDVSNPQPRFLCISGGTEKEFGVGVRDDGAVAMGWLDHSKRILPHEISTIYALIYAGQLDPNVNGMPARENTLKEGMPALASNIVAEDFTTNWVEFVYKTRNKPLVAEDNHPAHLDDLSPNVADRSAETVEKMVRYGVWDSEIPGEHPALVQLHWGSASCPNFARIWTGEGFNIVASQTSGSLVSQMCGALTQNPRRYTLLKRLAEQCLSVDDLLLFEMEKEMLPT